METPENPPEPQLSLEEARERMLNEHLKGRDITDPRVLAAMQRIPREAFVPGDLIDGAYDDSPLEIGCGQTISQPYIVAKMTELIEVKAGDRILEIGSGSGYQAAVLMELGAFVYCVDVVKDFCAGMEERFQRLGYQEYKISCHNGHRGWPEHAPFDAILLAAVSPELPVKLLDQVVVGGRIIAPVGTVNEAQTLKRWRLTSHGWREEDIFPVRFVPLIDARNRDRKRGET